MTKYHHTREQLEALRVRFVDGDEPSRNLAAELGLTPRQLRHLWTRHGLDEEMPKVVPLSLTMAQMVEIHARWSRERSLRSIALEMGVSYQALHGRLTRAGLGRDKSQPIRGLSRQGIEERARMERYTMDAIARRNQDPPELWRNIHRAAVKRGYPHPMDALRNAAHRMRHRMKHESKRLRGAA